MPRARWLRSMCQGTVRVRTYSTPVFHSGLGQILFANSPSTLTLPHWRSHQGGDEAHSPATSLATLPGIIKHLAHDPWSDAILAASEDGTVLMVDGDREEHWLTHGAPIRGLALFQDGRFVTGGADGLIKCWKSGPSAESGGERCGHGGATGTSSQFVNGGKELHYQPAQKQYHYRFGLDTLSFTHFQLPNTEDADCASVVSGWHREMIVDAGTPSNSSHRGEWAAR